MMQRLSLFALALAGGLAMSAAAAFAWEETDQPPTVGEAPERPDPQAEGWSTAPAIEGAVAWSVLGETREKVVEEEGERRVRPEFPTKVKDLDGLKIRLNGYMMPLDQTLLQSKFLLLAYPLHCPFCLSAGPTQMVEVRAEEPIEFDYDALLVEGQLELMTNNKDGLYYRMTDARAVN
jgi:hypothetical protein